MHQRTGVNNTAHITAYDAARVLQARRAARKHLIDFTRYTYPGYSVQWFHQLIGDVLTNVVRGLLPRDDPDYLPNAPKRVILNMPPRNGKSELVSRRLPAYALGRIPDLQIISASYASELATMMNRDVQQIIDDPLYMQLFPDTRLNGSNVRTTAYGQALRNSDIFEIVGHKGRYKGAGVGGSLTGLGAKLGIVDDPIKNREDAASALKREKTWRWYTSTLYTRLEDHAALIFCMTRWDYDDPVGRLQEIAKTEYGDQWIVIELPAIRDIEPDPIKEPFSYQSRKQFDPRPIGAPLWPDKYPLEVLKTIKALNPDDYESLQQQRPIQPGGSMFPKDKFKLLDSVTIHPSWELVRYWDKAATPGGGAYTSGVLLAYDEEATYGVNFIVIDVEREQYDPLEREQLIKRVADLDTMRFNDPYRVTIWHEQEPGSGGKESALNTTRNTLAGYIVESEVASGDKVVRAKPFSAQVKAGNVGVVSNAWVPDYIDELSKFPAGRYKDQVDASAGAFNKLSLGWHTEAVIVAVPNVRISRY